jgi:hypothetical protein
MEKTFIAAGVVLVALLFIVIRAYARSIRGVWVQEEGDGWIEILLDQNGPFVTGRSNAPDLVGHYEYSGTWTGKSVFLKRRDFGHTMLTGKGFPDTIAQKLEGTVMAKLNLKLQSPDTLIGFFYPQFIKWNKAQTRVEIRRFHDPRWRTWVRRESEAAQELIARKQAERQAKEEAERQARENAS